MPPRKVIGSGSGSCSGTGSHGNTGIYLIYFFNKYRKSFSCYLYCTDNLFIFTGDNWGTSGSQEIQPETAERLQQTRDFVADDPETTRTAEPTCFRLYTEEVEDIPLPPYSASTRELSERHYPLAFH